MNPHDEARAIALDELIWRVRRGDQPVDVFWALGQPALPYCGWNDALNALVTAWLRLHPLPMVA